MAIDDNASYELTGYQVKDLAGKIRAKADSSSLASVATSGLYSDLTGAPTIPTVYNGTLTIQQNGTQLGTFSANQSGNTTINITGGGGSTVTLFAYDSSGDMYDASFNYVTAQEVLTALGNGKVIVSDIIDYVDSNYEIVSSDSDSYFVAVSRHADGSPEFITFHYDSTSPTAPMGAWTRTAYVPQQKLTAGTNVSISGTTISATDTTYSNMTGATASVAGAAGLAPAPAAGDQEKVLHGDGTWKDTTAKLVEMSYGESSAWTKFINAYNNGSIVYCRASSNANPATGSQTRKAFMAYVNDASSPTSVEFQYVRSVSSKSSSQPVDQVFVYTLKNTNGGTWSVASRDMAPKLAAGTGTTVSYGSGTYTVNAEPDYSTSEVDTKVKWIDGKTIYRKTVNIGALPDSTTKTTAHSISSVGDIVDIKAIATNGSGTFLPLCSSSPYNVSYSVLLYADRTNITVQTGDDKTGYTDCYVTLYYTKSS